jgi:hypothetical protein
MYRPQGLACTVIGQKHFSDADQPRACDPSGVPILTSCKHGRIEMCMMRRGPTLYECILTPDDAKIQALSIQVERSLEKAKETSDATQARRIPGDLHRS